ncbi:M23 family metallopeptidase [Microbacterium halotolerans]|uniref:M23 family metallopeptidase n=1 Tax=Microbacterium halotolerans TaxID=246613 RepID=UPI001F090115|nr:M23 family metallopeptidase [Microbacterium halotolerans]
MGVAAGSVSAFAKPAAAYDPDDYPSWADVESARSSQSAKAAETRRIEGLISQLKENVAAAQARAEQAADAYYEAQQDAFAAAQRVEDLQEQADEAAKTANEAELAAARLAAQLTRTSGSETSLGVLFADSGASADDLLARLGQMDKLSEQNEAIRADAVAARDSAQALSDQAEVAREERDRLQKVAEKKLEEARAAQQEAEAALAQQEEHLVTLEAQLEALQGKTSKTVKEYKEGVKAKKEYEAEQRRKEEERRKREAEERAKNNSNNGGGGGSGGGGGGTSTGSNGGGGGGGSSSGWVRPNNGRLTSGFGPRMVQCGTGYCASGWHRGTDLAAGCGSPLYAAHSGTVIWAGGLGGYGNFVKIDHGGGIATGYAHQSYIVVSYGQRVSAGQVIGYEGNTGNSFGCHLHFEVFQGGGQINPAPFMAARGVYL